MKKEYIHKILIGAAALASILIPFVVTLLVSAFWLKIIEIFYPPFIPLLSFVLGSITTFYILRRLYKQDPWITSILAGVSIAVIVLLGGYAIYFGMSLCHNSLRFYDIPNKLLLTPSRYETQKREFVYYTRYCNQSDELVVDELIIFKKENGENIPARILEKRNDMYVVLTVNGEQIISKDAIIADD